MHKTTSVLTGAAFALALSGCGANPNAPATPATANVASNVLQFAVGTANLYGTGTGLNVVATYRQPTGGFKPGDSGALVDSPTLTIPGKLPALGPAVTSGLVPLLSDPLASILTGPASAEAATSAMTFSSQLAGTATVTTFGQSGGAFGLGLEPFNSYGPANAPSPGQSGTPFQVAPYPVPLYDASYATAGNANAFVPWGGPPAFDLLGNGQSPVGNTAEPPGTKGVSMGLDVFRSISPAAGTYTLSVAVPANTGTTTQSATATMPATPTLLGNATAATYTPDGNGGGTFAVTMPTGATEAYVEVVDMGPIQPTPPPVGSTATPAPAIPGCNGAAAATTVAPAPASTAPPTYSAGSPIYYTLKTTSGGTVTLPDTAGPGGTPSICSAAQNTKTNGGPASGDQILVWTIGFDYPAFESSYPSSLGNPSPKIVGSAGTADITISPAACAVDTGGGTMTACTPPAVVQGHLRNTGATLHTVRR